jgi:dipeptidyl aminopeptidase/acylaminoacyl peptidase
VLATRTVANPKPGSDEINRAFEDSWIGTNGYVRADGTRQQRALAFQGHVVTPRGETISEVFVADLPDDVTIPSTDGPLQGTETLRPRPPRGTTQRRLTYTAENRYPGVQGPRHWLRSPPDGGRIAFLMKDDTGVVQLWTVPPTGGLPTQVTHNSADVASAFTWSPDGDWIAHAMAGSVCVTNMSSGRTYRLTEPAAGPPRPEACVFSPDGTRIAFVRTIGKWNQVCVVEFEPRGLQ